MAAVETRKAQTAGEFEAASPLPKKELRETKRGNENLKAAKAFFGAAQRTRPGHAARLGVGRLHRWLVRPSAIEVREARAAAAWRVHVADA
jgi:hypothetical protein